MKNVSVKNLLNISNIGTFVSGTDIIKATRISKDEVVLEEKATYQDCTNYSFVVESQSFYDEFYNVFIKISHDYKILDVYCDCMKFQSFGTCKHLGAAILYNYEELFNIVEDNKTITNRIIDRFINKEPIALKKELTVNLNIVLNDRYYYGSYLEPKITIGIDKLYNLNTKVGAFQKVYEENHGEVNFGKFFTYNPSKYYFNEHDKIIIDAYLELSNGVNNRFYSNNEIKKYLQEVIVDELFIIYVNNESITDKINMALEGPTVILMVGVNGVGKTTTIAKLANKYKNEGKKVLMIAGDTFRAGAVEQLKIWAERTDSLFYGKENSDPAGVIFDGLVKAKEEKVDIVLIDTAGRLHNKINLMKELEKINKVIGNQINGAPHETLLVIDATTGQNGIMQAKAFKEITNITGIVLTKLDGTAKGGIVLAIKEEVNIPVKFVGLGEKMTDLITFDIENYIYGLFKEFL